MSVLFNYLGLTIVPVPLVWRSTKTVGLYLQVLFIWFQLLMERLQCSGRVVATLESTAETGKCDGKRPLVSCEKIKVLQPHSSSEAHNSSTSYVSVSLHKGVKAAVHTMPRNHVKVFIAIIYTCKCRITFFCPH